MLSAYASSFAQFDQLTVYANGNGTYSRSRDTQLSGDAESTFQNALGGISTGIFSLPKVLTGVGFSLTSSREESKNIPRPGLGGSNYTSVSAKSISWSLGPFVRYYMIRGFFCEANYTVGREESAFRLTDTDSMPGGSVSIFESSRKEKLRTFSIGAGYSFFVNKSRNLSIDAGVFYQSYKAASSFATISAGVGVSGFIFKKDNND
jgi:hypothetical protein